MNQDTIAKQLGIGVGRDGYVGMDSPVAEIASVDNEGSSSPLPERVYSNLITCISCSF